MFGIAFGVVQVAVPAFTLERGSASAGGVLLACLSLGSLIGGVVYGSRNWPGRLPPRLRRRSAKQKSKVGRTR